MSVVAPSTGCAGLAERVLGAASALPDEAAQAAAQRVFDTLGALAAARDAGAWPARSGELASDGELLATVRRLCAITRSSEIDDIERQSCTTPGSLAVPVALALAAQRRRAGDDVPGSRLLAAVAAGYEAMVAVGEAVDGPFVLYRGVWPSYLAAPVAAAATAGRLLELPPEQFVNALAIAAARMAGVAGRPPREPTSRWFVFGCAAADGVAAALAAEQGWVGDPGILEPVLALQTGGEVRAMVPPADLPAVARVDVKPFVTSRQGQAATQAARRAWADLGAADLAAVDSIQVGVPEAYRGMLDLPHVTDRLGSITSAQWQIAAALAEPALLYDVARPDPVPSAARARLMETVTVVADPELTPRFPRVWPGRVTVRLRDGREATREVTEPDGAADPAPDWDWLVAKHRALGGLGDNLDTVCTLCRGLGSDTAVPANDLLNLTLRQPIRRHP